MGTWGTAILSDDTAAEIRDTYRNLLATGLADSAAIAQLRLAHLSTGPALNAAVESTFWLTLAFAQWELGRLSSEVQTKAISIIDSGEDMARWRGGGASEATLRQRSKSLLQLREKLLSPQPPRKTPRLPPKRKPSCAIGDIFRYQLPSGRQVLLRVTHLAEGEFPIAEPLDWLGEPTDPLPANFESPDFPARRSFTPRGPRPPLCGIMLDLKREPPDPARFSKVGHCHGLPERPAGPTEGGGENFLDTLLPEKYRLS